MEIETGKMFCINLCLVWLDIKTINNEIKRNFLDFSKEFMKIENTRENNTNRPPIKAKNIDIEIHEFIDIKNNLFDK